MRISIEPGGNSPMDRARRRFRRKCRNLMLLLCVVVGTVIFAGVPHLQWDYKYPAWAKPRSGPPASADKTEARYFSVTGLKSVQAGQYGQRGCPVFLFIPLKDCVDLSGLPDMVPFTFIKE
jgi:hypothetical protein